MKNNADDKRIKTMLVFFTISLAAFETQIIFGRYNNTAKKIIKLNKSAIRELKKKQVNMDKVVHIMADITATLNESTNLHQPKFPIGGLISDK